MFKVTSEKIFPKLGDPRKFTQQGIVIEGLVPVSELPRVLEATEADSGAAVHVRLDFHISEEKKRAVVGIAAACLGLICQRCLERVDVEIESDISLAVVWDEDAAKALPPHFDPWIVGEGAADLYEMIEEELLLSLPAVAYHDHQCVDDALYSSGKPVEVKVERNPFQVLEQLKSSPKS
jgi:uncharacterized protein